MRYTTIIDISESAPLYKSVGVRLVYMHLVLKSGYHDHDRDLVKISLRQIAEQTGLTLSATRHAVAVLERAKMIARNGGVYRVRKWIVEQPISARAKTAKQQAQIDEAARRRAEKEQYEREQAIEAARRESFRLQGKNSYMVYYEEKLRLAESGDIEAQEFCRANREKYEEFKKAMQKEPQ